MTEKCVCATFEVCSAQRDNLPLKCSDTRISSDFVKCEDLPLKPSRTFLKASPARADDKILSFSFDEASVRRTDKKELLEKQRLGSHETRSHSRFCEIPRGLDRFHLINKLCLYRDQSCCKRFTKKDVTIDQVDRSWHSYSSNRNNSESYSGEGQLFEKFRSPWVQRLRGGNVGLRDASNMCCSCLALNTNKPENLSGISGALGTNLHHIQNTNQIVYENQTIKGIESAANADIEHRYPREMNLSFDKFGNENNSTKTDNFKQSVDLPRNSELSRYEFLATDYLDLFKTLEYMETRREFKQFKMTSRLSQDPGHLLINDLEEMDKVLEKMYDFRESKLSDDCSESMFISNENVSNRKISFVTGSASQNNDSDELSETLTAVKLTKCSRSSSHKRGIFRSSPRKIGRRRKKVLKFKSLDPSPARLAGSASILVETSSRIIDQSVEYSSGELLLKEGIKNVQPPNEGSEIETFTVTRDKHLNQSPPTFNHFSLHSSGKKSEKHLTILGACDREVEQILC